MRMASLVLFIGALAAGSPAVVARDLEFNLAGGATELFIDDEAEDDEVLNEQWGPWVRPSFSLAPIADAPQFRLGGGVGFSWTRGEIDDAFLAGDADLFLITPELLLSWRQPLGDAGRWYLEPGVGVGGVIGALWVIGTDWGYGYSVRPFLRAAYQSDDWSAGVEASYRFGNLDFGDSDGEIENLEVGVFVAFKI